MDGEARLVAATRQITAARPRRPNRKGKLECNYKCKNKLLILAALLLLLVSNPAALSLDATDTTRSIQIPTGGLGDQLDRFGLELQRLQAPSYLADDSIRLADYDEPQDTPRQLQSNQQLQLQQSRSFWSLLTAALISPRNATFNSEPDGPQQPSGAGYEVNWSNILLATVLILIMLITAIGNLFVIVAILIERNLRTIGNYLVLSLAIADLLVALLVMPLAGIYQILQSWELGILLCDIWTSADVFCCTASILHLLAIALDRYWAVTRVDYIRCQRNEKRILLMITFVWTLACTISLAPVFGWKDENFEWRITNDHECLISQDISFQIFATCTTFYFPMVLTLTVYWKIYQVARKRIRRKPGNRVKISLQQPSSSSSISSPGSKQQLHQKSPPSKPAINCNNNIGKDLCKEPLNNNVMGQCQCSCHQQLKQRNPPKSSNGDATAVPGQSNHHNCSTKLADDLLPVINRAKDKKALLESETAVLVVNGAAHSWNCCDANGTEEMGAAAEARNNNNFGPSIDVGERQDRATDKVISSHDDDGDDDDDDAGRMLGDNRRAPSNPLKIMDKQKFNANGDDAYNQIFEATKNTDNDNIKAGQSKVNDALQQQQQERNLAWPNSEKSCEPEEEAGEREPINLVNDDEHNKCKHCHQTEPPHCDNDNDLNMTYSSLRQQQQQQQQSNQPIKIKKTSSTPATNNRPKESLNSVHSNSMTVSVSSGDLSNADDGRADDLSSSCSPQSSLLLINDHNTTADGVQLDIRGLENNKCSYEHCCGCCNTNNISNPSSAISNIQNSFDFNIENNKLSNNCNEQVDQRQDSAIIKLETQVVLNGNGTKHRDNNYSIELTMPSSCEENKLANSWATNGSGHDEYHRQTSGGQPRLATTIVSLIQTNKVIHYWNQLRAQLEKRIKFNQGEPAPLIGTKKVPVVNVDGKTSTIEVCKLCECPTDQSMDECKFIGANQNHPSNRRIPISVNESSPAELVASGVPPKKDAANTTKAIVASSTANIAAATAAASPKPIQAQNFVHHQAHANCTSINQAVAANEGIESKREKKAAKTLAIITGVFVMCWSPFFIMALTMTLLNLKPHKFVFAFLLWLGYINSMLNPIIYTIFSPDFRKAFKRLLCAPIDVNARRAAMGAGNSKRANFD